MGKIKIDCYLSPECASEEPLRKNIHSALTAEKIKVNVGFHRIDDDEAISLGLSGSPSVFINGKELQPQGTVGFAWRMYRDEFGKLSNVPSVETLQAAIKDSRNENKS